MDYYTEMTKKKQDVVTDKFQPKKKRNLIRNLEGTFYTIEIAESDE